MAAEDRLRLEGMEFHGSIGVSDAERELLTRITVDVELRIDLSRAGASDDLRDTINYSALYTELATIAEGRSFHLLEALAETMATTVLSHHRVDSVQLRVAKQPPLRGHVRAAVVTIERGRGARA